MVLFIRYLLPLLLYISFIIFMSSQPNIKTETVIPDNYLKTLAHFIEYFILSILSYRFINQISKQAIFYTILFVLLFAISDELHQYFVDTRTASGYDILVDVIGMCVGLFIIKRGKSFYKKIKYN